MAEVAFLLYRSETDMRPNSEAAQQLMATARQINEECELTGYLHHEDGIFFQWLEGPAEQLGMIAARIERDTRHMNMSYLWRGTRPDRKFSTWKMGYSSRSDGSILSWLADHPVAQRQTQAYAENVLAFLLERTASAAD